MSGGEGLYPSLNTFVSFYSNILTSRKQRTKISDAYSSWQEILSGVPQSPILRPLLFNNEICDLFFIIEDCYITNYTDDNIPYLSGKNVEQVLNGLENASKCFIYFNGLLKIERKCKQMSFTDTKMCM